MAVTVILIIAVSLNLEIQKILGLKRCSLGKSIWRMYDEGIT